MLFSSCACVCVVVGGVVLCRCVCVRPVDLFTLFSQMGPEEEDGRLLAGPRSPAGVAATSKQKRQTAAVQDSDRTPQREAAGMS